jgi:hypothetical protein
MTLDKREHRWTIFANLCPKCAGRQSGTRQNDSIFKINNIILYFFLHVSAARAAPKGVRQIVWTKDRQYTYTNNDAAGLLDHRVRTSIRNTR